MTVSFFNVENNLIDRTDLNIYEKMCSVVLARYAGRSEFSNMLSIPVIATRMGCSPELAEKALQSLIDKKLILLEDTGRIEPELLAVDPVKVSTKVIRSEGLEASGKVAANVFEHLESFEEEKPKAKKKPSRAKKAKAETEAALVEEAVLTPPEEAPKVEAKKSEKKTKQPMEATHEKLTAPEIKRPIVPKQVREGVQDLIDQIFDIIDENINDREARIILSFANNDVELIREKYKIAKRSQVSDKIEMLINELQRKEGAETHRETPAISAEPDKMPAPLKQPQNTQIDLDNINRMVAFKHSSYNKAKK